MKKFLVVLTLFFACSSTIFAQTKLNVGILNGPSCIPVAYMMEKPELLKDVKVQYEKFADPQALLPKLIKSEVDIGFMPVNVAAKVYNSTNKAIICAAVCGNGNLTVVTKDNSIKGFSDLKGKTLYVAGQGATPEYITRYLLNYYKLEDSIKLDFSIPTANLAAAVISGKIDYAVLPEPFSTVATSKDKAVKNAVNLQKEYKVCSGNETFPLTCIVVRKEYAEKNPQTVKAFLDSFSNAVVWTIKNPGLAGNYCEKYQLGLAAGIVAKSIPNANYVYLPAQNSKKQIEDLLLIFMENDSASIGKTLPDNDFYLNLELNNNEE